MKKHQTFGLTQALLAIAFCMLQLHGALGCGFIGSGRVHCEHAGASSTSKTTDEDHFCPCDHSKPNEDHSRDVCAATVFAPVRTFAELFSFVFIDVRVDWSSTTAPLLPVESRPFFQDDASLASDVAPISLYLLDCSFLI